MKRNLGLSIGIVTLLFATMASVKEANAQSYNINSNWHSLPTQPANVGPEVTSQNDYSSQNAHSSIQVSQIYSPMQQVKSQFWTPQFTPAVGQGMPDTLAFQRAGYPQPAISPPAYTYGTTVCQPGGS